MSVLDLNVKNFTETSFLKDEEMTSIIGGAGVRSGGLPQLIFDELSSRLSDQQIINITSPFLSNPLYKAVYELAEAGPQM